MNTSIKPSADSAASTKADSTTDKMVSPVNTPGFNLFNRSDFAAGVKSFREHFGQDVRSKIPEGYTFLGIHQQSNAIVANNAKPHSADGGSVGADQQQQPAPSSVGSGVSHTHSTNSQVSHPGNRNRVRTNATAAAPAASAVAPPPSKNAKSGAPMRRDANNENLSTLDNLLSYMKRSPKVASAAPHAAGKSTKPPASTAKAPSGTGAKFAKTVVLSQAKSRIDALDISLPKHLSVDMPPTDRLVLLRQKAGNLCTKIAQKQQQQRERAHQRKKQQQKEQRKQKQLDAINLARSKSDMLLDNSAKELTKQRQVPGATVVVEIGRKVKELCAKRTADTRRKSATVARESVLLGKLDNEKPMAGQKRTRSCAELEIRVPKKARHDVVEALTAVTPAKKRPAPVDDYSDETQQQQQPSNKRARKLSKSSPNGGDIGTTSPRSALHSSPPLPPASISSSRSPSLSPRMANGPRPAQKKPALFRDRSALAKTKASAQKQGQRLTGGSRSPPEHLSGTSKGKDALGAEKPGAGAARRAAIKTPPKAILFESDAKARDLEVSTTPGTIHLRAVNKDTTGRPPKAAAPAALALAPASGSVGGPSGIGSNMQASEIEQLRRQSTRLENFMRSFKRCGDAERDPGGRVELEVGYYLESLSCCLEDFWCRRVVQSPQDVNKNWQTMLGICEYLYKRCESRDLAALSGCTGLIAACVYYQLLSVSTELLQGLKEPEKAKQLIADIARYTKEMEKYEQVWRVQLSARHVSRMFPQTWNRCQEVALSRLGPFEMRSNPYTKKWPAVAYPVGATSNPLDVANFVRQMAHEWLNRLGLGLKMPNQKEAA